MQGQRQPERTGRRGKDAEAVRPGSAAAQMAPPCPQMPTPLPPRDTSVGSPAMQQAWGHERETQSLPLCSSQSTKEGWYCTSMMTLRRKVQGVYSSGQCKLLKQNKSQMCNGSDSRSVVLTHVVGQKECSSLVGQLSSLFPFSMHPQRPLEVAIRAKGQ